MDSGITAASSDEKAACVLGDISSRDEDATDIGVAGMRNDDAGTIDAEDVTGAEEEEEDGTGRPPVWGRGGEG